MRSLRKKAQALSTLQNVVLALVVIGFIVAVGLLLLIKVKDTNQTSAQVNTSIDEVIDAIDDVPTFMGIIVLAFVALVVIGVILLLQRNRA